MKKKKRNFDWGRLAMVDDDGDHPAIPALCAFFYFSAPVHEIAAELAAGVEAYVDYVGLDALVSYSAPSGDWKVLTKRQYDKDLRHLRNFPADHIAVTIDYEAGQGGEPGPFGIYLDADKDRGETWKDLTNHLRLDFPVDWLDSHDVEEFMALIVRIAEFEHVQTANVGYAFKSTSGSEGDAVSRIFEKIPRYLAFDPCDLGIRYHMQGHTFTAHWLNYLDDDMADELGGPDAIVEALPGCEVRKLAKGVLIRGAKLPPIGDSNRKAPDIGRLPDVARLLAPTRLDLSDTGFAGEAEDHGFDAEAWMERLDTLASTDWDNS
jgi:hypothetical protein